MLTNKQDLLYEELISFFGEITRGIEDDNLLIKLDQKIPDGYFTGRTISGKKKEAN